MASRFESDIFGTSAWAVLASVHGEAVSVKPQGGPGYTNVAAIFHADEVAESDHEDGEETQSRGVLKLGPDAVAAIVAANPGWVAQPGDLVQRGSAVYAVEKVGALEPIVELHILKIVERRWGGSGNHAKR